MNRNLSTEAHKINKKEKKSLETDRDMSIENISLSPQPESDNTRTYKNSCYHFYGMLWYKLYFSTIII